MAKLNQGKEVHLMNARPAVVHVTGANPEEINDSFNAAMTHYTQPGKQFPSEAIRARLRRESKAAFAAIGIDTPEVISEEARQIAAERKAAKAAAKADPGTVADPEVKVATVTELAPKAAKAAPAPVESAEPKTMHDHCVDCGFEFKRPQARKNCASPAACAKRQEAKKSA